MTRLANLAIAATVAATPLVVISTATPAQAYCYRGIGRWNGNYHRLAARRSIPNSWQSSVKRANKQWDGIRGSRLDYGTPVFNSDIRNPPFGMSRVNFRNAGFPDVPGMASGSATQRHRYVTVYLNSRFKWNTTGTMNQRERKVDVWTIAVHEIGHASGLAHPYRGTPGCGGVTRAEKASVMYVTWKKKRYINSDDRAGIAARY